MENKFIRADEVGKMNTIREAATEIVNNDLIFS